MYNFSFETKKSLMRSGSSCGSTCLTIARIKLNVQLLCEVFFETKNPYWELAAVVVVLGSTHQRNTKILSAKHCQRQCGLSCTRLETMDQISIVPNS